MKTNITLYPSISKQHQNIRKKKTVSGFSQLLSSWKKKKIKHLQNSGPAYAFNSNTCWRDVSAKKCLHESTQFKVDFYPKRLGNDSFNKYTWKFWGTLYKKVYGDRPRAILNLWYIGLTVKTMSWSISVWSSDRKQ